MQPGGYKPNFQAVSSYTPPTQHRGGGRGRSRGRGGYRGRGHNRPNNASPYGYQSPRYNTRGRGRRNRNGGQTGKYYCQACEEEFRAKWKYDSHLKTHVSCEYKGCNFCGNKDVMKLHMMGHMGNSFTDSPEDVEDYIAARKKKFPTRAKRDLLKTLRQEGKGWRQQIHQHGDFIAYTSQPSGGKRGGRGFKNQRQMTRVIAKNDKFKGPKSAVSLMQQLISVDVKKELIVVLECFEYFLDNNFFSGEPSPRTFDRDKIYASVFVRNLDESITEEALFEAFKHISNILGVEWRCRDVTGEFLGFALVHFSTKEGAQQAIREMNKKIIGNKEISCNFFRTPNAIVHTFGWPEDTTEERVKELFETHGDILEIVMLKGEAYVVYVKVGHARGAAREKKHFTVDDRKIKARIVSHIPVFKIRRLEKEQGVTNETSVGDVTPSENNVTSKQGVDSMEVDS